MRDLDTDAAYGIEQLAVIGWTSVSTAKSNPSPGRLVIHSLRDLLSRWSTAEAVDDASERTAALTEKMLPVIYDDDVFDRLLDAFETLAVVASESMQPQTITDIVDAFTLMFERLPLRRQQRVEDVIRRSLSALGEHVLTARLDAALSELAAKLQAAGRNEVAGEVRAAQAELGKSVGMLSSRATRATRAPNAH